MLVVMHPLMIAFISSSPCELMSYRIVHRILLMSVDSAQYSSAIVQVFGQAVY
jgi:hypothetical protein